MGQDSTPASQQQRTPRGTHGSTGPSRKRRRTASHTVPGLHQPAPALNGLTTPVGLPSGAGPVSCSPSTSSTCTLPAPSAHGTSPTTSAAAAPRPMAIKSEAEAGNVEAAAGAPAAAGAAGPGGGKGLGKGRMGAAPDAAAAAAPPAVAGNAVPAVGGYMKPDVVKLPLEIGSRVACKWRDDQYHTAKIIERRPTAGAPNPDTHDYYVHYLGYNRRMDEWVTEAQLDLSTVEVEIPDPDPKKRKKVIADDHNSDSDHGDFDPNALREHEEFTKVKNIEMIELGRHQMETWYFSPFPPEYKDCKMLYFCEYSLQFFKRRSQLLRHTAKVKTRHPPGEEIYRNGNVCMFEVDGKREKAWCQNLCFLAKLFLDHKTLFYDVDLFLFYVLCEIDERGAHVVGYFSKEKSSEEGYNLACILTLPAYQRKGYGKALISMSYELSKIEGKVGTPERPLSDLGRVSYHGYWTRELLSILSDHQGTISIKELSERTAIRTEDITQTLTQLGLIQYQKGQHVLCAAPHIIQQKLKQAGGPGLVIHPSKIVWTPYNAEREYEKFRN